MSVISAVRTIKMYADGGAEELVGEAIDGRQDEVFLVSKVDAAKRHAAGHHCRLRAHPHGAWGGRTRSLPAALAGRGPTERDLDAFDTLIGAGKIRHWGVSNFDVDDLEELIALPGGEEVATNQVLYNLVRRGIEYDLLPWCKRNDIPIMAYSPIEQGRVLRHPAVTAIAARHRVTSAQVALAWVLRQDGVCAIPRAAKPAHVRENRAALDIGLTLQDLADLDRAFPPPTYKQPLAVH